MSDDFSKALENNVTIDFASLKSEIDSIPDKFLIIDRFVYNHYFQDYKGKNLVVLKSCEKNKSLETVRLIIDKLIAQNFDKNSTIIAIGGGIVCDVAGFVASIYKRGTLLVLVPTTLLAMADAVIGGKNAINHNNIKNIVGSYKLPQIIFICTKFLNTLDKSLLNEGFAEIVKISLVYKSKLFYALEKYINEIKKTNIYLNQQLEPIISTAISTKVKIVKKDFYDEGIRNILNFGHTFGHAIESIYGISHGNAVASGMLVASFISLQYKYISDTTYSKIEELLAKFGFNKKIDFDVDKVMKLIAHDKKKNKDYIREVLLTDIGKSKLVNISIEEYRQHLNDLRKHW